MPYAYRKSERLRKNSDFAATRQGKRLSSDGLYLFYRRNDIGSFRVGISVGKKLANAVRRNRLRRQIRESLSRLLHDRSAGFDLLFVARQELLNRDFSEILAAAAKILERSEILKKKTEGGAQ